MKPKKHQETHKAMEETQSNNRIQRQKKRALKTMTVHPTSKKENSKIYGHKASPRKRQERHATKTVPLQHLR